MIKFVQGIIPGRPYSQAIAVIEGDTHISKWVAESGRLDHDRAAVPRIVDLITPGLGVLDLGAFIGDHTLAYAAKAAPGVVLAVEVNAQAVSCLAFNAGGFLNVKIAHTAVGDGVEGGRLLLDPNVGASHLAPSLEAPRSRKVDDLWPTHEPLCLMKLDIEGWEVRALIGAMATIKRWHPIIVCEVNAGALARVGTSPVELHALLTYGGYKMRDLISEEPWLPGDDRLQFDIVAKWGGK